MNKPNYRNIPVYSLNKFSRNSNEPLAYQIEVFDANRHFKVQYPHRHDFYEVLFLNRGSGFHIIDNNKYNIQPPCIFFMSPGQAHKLELSRDIGGYILLFTHEYYLINQKNKNRLLEFPFFFSVNQENPPLLLSSESDVNFIESLFKRGIREFGSTSAEFVRSVLDLILLTADRLYPDALKTGMKVKGHILVKKFFQYIEENYQRNLRINEYADMLHISPNHLTQITKEITGKTSVALLRQKVIVEVKRLLVHTNLTISEIAELMHFPDQSYFSKYFKKSTGESPKDFRRRFQK